jgi:SAM-dependent methyltransferase
VCFLASPVPRGSSYRIPFYSVSQWDADLYQERHDFVWKYGSSVVDLLDPKPGESILDVGCGTGELTNDIADRVFAGSSCGDATRKEDGARTGIVFGMDADISMIQRAQGTYGGITFFKGDAADFTLPSSVVGRDSCESLPSSVTHVDAVFSNAALHWVRDAEAAVASMSRALKPGGRFVVEFGGKGNVDRIVQAANRVLNMPPGTNPWYFPTIGEYSTVLEKYGIEVTNAVLFDRPTVLEGGEDGMRNWLQMFGSGVLWSDQSSARDQDQVVDEIVALLRPVLYDGENWTADYRRLRIVGQKRM